MEVGKCRSQEMEASERATQRNVFEELEVTFLRILCVVSVVICSKL